MTVSYTHLDVYKRQDADSGEDYFEQARLTRSKTRDEALDKIQTILKDAQLTDEEKEEVTKSLSQQLENITLEGEIESLIKAKGFSDCIVFLDGEMVSAAVKTGGEALDKTSVAQIRDCLLYTSSPRNGQDNAPPGLFESVVRFRDQDSCGGRAF